MKRKEFLEVKVRESMSRAKSEPLVDVTTGHGHVLTPSECQEYGVTPDTPCFCVSRGINGKRPLYAMEGGKGLIIAWGTFFGRESTFGFFPPGDFGFVYNRLGTADKTRYNFLED